MRHAYVAPPGVEPLSARSHTSGGSWKQPSGTGLAGNGTTLPRFMGPKNPRPHRTPQPPRLSFGASSLRLHEFDELPMDVVEQAFVVLDSDRRIGLLTLDELRAAVAKSSSVVQKQFPPEKLAHMFESVVSSTGSQMMTAQHLFRACSTRFFKSKAAELAPMWRALVAAMLPPGSPTSLVTPREPAQPCIVRAAFETDGIDSADHSPRLMASQFYETLTGHTQELHQLRDPPDPLKNASPPRHGVPPKSTLLREMTPPIPSPHKALSKSRAPAMSASAIHVNSMLAGQSAVPPDLKPTLASTGIGNSKRAKAEDNMPRPPTVPFFSMEAKKEFDKVLLQQENQSRSLGATFADQLDIVEDQAYKNKSAFERELLTRSAPAAARMGSPQAALTRPSTNTHRTLRSKSLMLSESSSDRGLDNAPHCPVVKDIVVKMKLPSRYDRMLAEVKACSLEKDAYPSKILSEFHPEFPHTRTDYVDTKEKGIIDFVSRFSATSNADLVRSIDSNRFRDNASWIDTQKASPRHVYGTKQLDLVVRDNVSKKDAENEHCRFGTYDTRLIRPASKGKSVGDRKPYTLLPREPHKTDEMRPAFLRKRALEYGILPTVETNTMQLGFRPLRPRDKLVELNQSLKPMLNDDLIAPPVEPAAPPVPSKRTMIRNRAKEQSSVDF